MLYNVEDKDIDDKYNTFYSTKTNDNNNSRDIALDESINANIYYIKGLVPFYIYLIYLERFVLNN